MDIQEYLARYQAFLEKDYKNLGLSLKDVLESWTTLKNSVDEYFARLYIEYTCDTQDPQKSAAFTKAIEDMELFSPLNHKIEQKVLESFPESSKEFQYAYELLKNDMALFREENIPLETQEGKLSQNYQALIGALTIEYEGKTLPLAMAKPFLENSDRSLRKSVFEKICQSYAEVDPQVDEIFAQQVGIRDKIAKNASFENYRDYVHKSKARFDYTPEDCLTFSDSIYKAIVPYSSALHEKKRKRLQLPELTPFDTSIDPFGTTPLKPAETPEDFLQKSIEVLTKVSHDVGETLKTLSLHNQLDLFSRQGKAPGGYNYPLPASKTSFIFMNCAFVHQDAVTLFHEAGHAYHFDLYKNNPDPFFYKSPSSEIAELASMSMELMSMEYWTLLYPKEEDYRRAKYRQLEGILHFFPWMAIVDSFQHWIYTHPQASIQERNTHFVHLYKKFLPQISWKEMKSFLPTYWHKQLHIIEMPFYYIEYGIAQLGALQIWKWYKENPQNGLQRYQKALSFASKGPITEAFAQAGISIAFTPEYIQPLIEFLHKELQSLE